MTRRYSHTHIGEARHDAACYCCHIFVLLHFTTVYPIGIFRRIGLVLPPHLCVHQNPELHRTLHQTTETRLSHSQTQILLQGIVALSSLTRLSLSDFHAGWAYICHASRMSVKKCSCHRQAFDISLP